MLLCRSRFVCVPAVMFFDKIIQDVPASQHSWDPSRMCRFGCDNVAQARAQSCIASSSLLGSFGAGLGHGWRHRGNMPIVFVWAYYATFPCSLGASGSSHHRCGYQRVLKFVQPDLAGRQFFHRHQPKIVQQFDTSS